MNTPIDFTGRTVIVTGAGNGIGRAHALMLGERGASVVVNDIGGTVNGAGGDGTAAQSVVEEIRGAGGKAVASTDSIATPEGGEAVVARAIDAFGRVDAVIHNAGILRDRSFAKITGDDIDPVLDVHLRGAFHVVRPAWPHMIEQRYGRILLTTSASGLLGNYGQASYAAGKAGLLGLMNVLSVEGARHGIRVNALSPTAATRMTEGLLGELAEHFDPRHVAAVATYLVSDRCELTHHVISASGGRVARLFVGSTRGWYGGREPVEPEAVHDALGEILSLDGFIVPETGDDEVALIQQALQGN